jgi:hypothetical protein
MKSPDWHAKYGRWKAVKAVTMRNTGYEPNSNFGQLVKREMPGQTLCQRNAKPLRHRKDISHKERPNWFGSSFQKLVAMPLCVCKPALYCELQQRVTKWKMAGVAGLEPVTNPMFTMAEPPCPHK